MKSLGGIINDTLKLILLRKKFYYQLNLDKRNLSSKNLKKNIKNEKSEIINKITQKQN